MELLKEYEDPEHLVVFMEFCSETKILWARLENALKTCQMPLRVHWTVILAELNLSPMGAGMLTVSAAVGKYLPQLHEQSAHIF